MLERFKAWLKEQRQQWYNINHCIRMEQGYPCRGRKCLGQEEH